ncbi:MAG: hypothetical protein ISN28_14640 [Ectothiorhodospiraceae bacterium AqS1]|nr:hypothetical protein [Ectothiorhodospiraceae bacterium AqS1]
MTGIARILSLALMMLGMSVFSAYGVAGAALEEEEADEIGSSSEEGAQASLILSTDEISVIEGDAHQTITIRLGSQPSEDVRVIYRLSNPHIQVRIPSSSPYYIAFTPSDWNIPQTIGIRAFDDVDRIDYTDTISFSSTGFDTEVLTVNVFDYASVAPEGEIALSPTSLSISESGQGRFTVKLDVRPSAAVTISLTHVNPDITISPKTLTFRNDRWVDNWSETRIVDLYASKDSDSVDETDTVTLGASGGNYDGMSAVVSVAIVDEGEEEESTFDVQGSHELHGLKMKEGETKLISFMAVDGQLPDVDTVVSLTNTNPDITLTPNSLTFRPASSGTLKGNLIQLVSVHAAQDSDLLDDTDTITLQGDIASSRRILVSVEDTTLPAEKGSLILSDGALSVGEGRTATFTVKLDTKPSEDVHVSLTNTNPDIALSPGSLTFTASNWNVLQSVNVTAAHDSDYRGERDTITLRASGGGGIYDGVSATKSVAIVDDDIGAKPPAYLILSPDSLSLGHAVGRTGTFRVGLRTQPDEDVEVSLANTNPDVTFSPTSFTFTPSQWSAWRVVTVRADTGSDHTQSSADTITLGASGDEAYEGLTARVSITIPDDVAWHGKHLDFSPSSLSLDEGGTGTFTVKLARWIYYSSTLLLTNTNPDITLSPSSLEFNSLNWNVGQTVTVSAAHDSDASDDSDTVSFRDSSGDRFSQSASITVRDDDSGGIPVLSTTSLSLDEGASKTFTVKLDRRPSANSSISLTNTNPDITVNPTSLTFTASNWNSAQVVTVSAALDDDIVDDTDTITLSGTGFAPKIVEVSIKDDKTVTPPGEGEGEIILSPAGTLVIDEGDKQNLEVKLGARPGADVTVSITNGNPDITLTPASLTFTTSNWNTAQSVSVAAALDGDDVNDSDTLTLRASGGGYELATATKAVSVIDIDREGGLPEILVLSTASLSLDEGGSKTFTVKLSEQPAADTQVSLANTNTDITLTPSSLIFTTSNWNTAQTVTVSAARDDDDKDDTDTITLTTPDFAPEIVDVSVKDDTVIAPEPPPAEPGEIILSPTRRLMIGEGSRANLTVELGTRPSGAEVTVSFTKSNPNIVLAPPLLIFTASNWNIPQTVGIEAEEDGDAANDTDTLTVSAPGFASKTLFIVVTDNGTNTPEGEIVLNTEEIEIEEGGREDFTIRLDTKPSADVFVSLSRSNRDIEISPSGPLAFTASNWNIPQSVTVAARSDADAEDDTGTVILKASGGIVAPTATLPVVIIDNTVVSPVVTGTLSLSPGTPEIGEGGSGTFTVALGTPPSAAVTVSLTKTNPDIDLSSTSESFDASNWNAARTITVRAAHDDDGTNDTDTITLIASGGNYAGVRATKSITVIDDDIEGGISGLVLSTRLMRMEEGSSRTFTARLDKRPSRDIHLSFSSTNPDIALAPEWLIFTASNWNPEQAVTVSARVDSDKQYDIGTVIVNARGDSRGFVDLPSTILVFIDDTTVEPPPETGRLDLSAGGLAIREGESGSFTIALGVRPSADVRVSLTKTNPDIALSPATPLAFTASNWNAAQTVTVKALHDDDTEDDSDTITVTASGGNYDEVTAGKSITVADDDIEGGIPEHLILSTSTLSVDEGGSKRFSVKLGTSPSRIVSVSSATADAALELSPTTLFFTDADWNEWQSFTVNALQDGDDTDDVALVILKAAGGIVESTKTILVTIVDKIAAAPPPPTGTLKLSPGPLEIEEGTSGAFTVALDVRPSAEVMVSLANSNPDIALSPKAPLIFTASNWNVPQIITATAAHDDDDRDDNDSVRLDASGGNYDQVSAYQPITVFDDDLEEGEGGTPDLVLSKLSLSVIRGGSQAFTVNLAARPSQTISVNTASSDADITLSPASLSFTDSNWNTAQTVTVSVARGSELQQGTINLSASGLAPKTMTVKVSDAETNEPSIAPEEAAGALVLSTKRLSIGEGETGAFEVGLAIRPSRTVTISIDSDDRGITIAESRLYFTPSNWSATQALTLSAEEDEDSLDDTATITLTAQGGNYDGADAKVIVDVMDDDEPIALPSSVELPVKTQALALPPPTVQDSATMRVRCRSGNSPCIVRFSCTAQEGTVLTGVLPWTIPALGSMSFDSKEIANIVGGSWEGKGRLGCELQSDAKLGSQVWTRSGNGVLVNNSAAIRSAQEGSGYRADIESIPSPDSPEKSNIRIRCLAPPGASCSQISLACFDDAGVEYPGAIAPIPSRSVRHLQTQNIADIIAHRWQGMSLSCELRSNQPFTAQVLTRTGGGGALVNNSATGTK